MVDYTGTHLGMVRVLGEGVHRTGIPHIIQRRGRKATPPPCTWELLPRGPRCREQGKARLQETLMHLDTPATNYHILCMVTTTLPHASIEVPTYNHMGQRTHL